jgi:hypothetical protein
MNGWNWQLVVAAAIVAWAVVTLALRAVRLLAAPEQASCGGGCTQCPATDSAADKSIVQLNTADTRLKNNSTNTA